MKQIISALSHVCSSFEHMRMQNPQNCRDSNGQNLSGHNIDLKLLGMGKSS